LSSSKYRLGIDIGGTFTDLTLIEQCSGKVTGLKTPTIALNPEQGILNGLRLLEKEKGVRPEEIDYFVHGMTIGLNTLLQRKGSKIALFVTDGFRDILMIQRLRLPIPYDFHSRLPEPLIPRELVFGIQERIRSDGSVLNPLVESSIDEALEKAKSAGVTGIVLCFLNSYKNPMHEKLTAERIQKISPDIKVCASSQLWPEMQEYERAIIATINLYIQANVEEYFDHLKVALKKEGVTVEPFITQSNGGIMDLEDAAKAPVRTLFSGPAAGVIGAIRVAETAQIRDFLTFDMGGTSTDISFVEGGLPCFSQGIELGGFPVMLPTIDIASIGAGGGSIGWFDRGGLLKVGPESAGSDPGPACYGKSSRPALTDAFLLCGYLNPDRFAAGQISLDISRSEKAILQIAQRLSTDAETAADRMIQISIANMYSELSNVMEQRGFDPRDLSVLAFGGAGPVAANFIAEEIHAKNVLVPPRPGTLCAMGSLSANFVYDAVHSCRLLLPEVTPMRLLNEFELLKKEAKDWVERQKVSVLEGYEIQYSADARYKGQSYEIQIPILPSQLQEKDCSSISKVFHCQHQMQYGHDEPQEKVELTNLRARILAYTPKINEPSLETSLMPAQKVGTRTILCRGQSYQAAIYSRYDLKANQKIEGPAIVEQDDTTTLILPCWFGKIDQYGNLLISRNSKEED
jgi:N-methylhydantoinase A